MFEHYVSLPQFRSNLFVAVSLPGNSLIYLLYNFVSRTYNTLLAFINKSIVVLVCVLSCYVVSFEFYYVIQNKRIGLSIIVKLPKTCLPLITVVCILLIHPIVGKEQLRNYQFVFCLNDKLQLKFVWVNFPLAFLLEGTFNFVLLIVCLDFLITEIGAMTSYSKKNICTNNCTRTTKKHVQFNSLFRMQTSRMWNKHNIGYYFYTKKYCTINKTNL